MKNWRKHYKMCRAVKYYRMLQQGLRLLRKGLRWFASTVHYYCIKHSSNFFYFVINIF